MCDDGFGGRRSATDHFGNKAGGEWSQIRKNEVAHWVWWVLCGGEGLVEVVHGEGSEDGDDNIVVGEIGVDFLAKREVGGGGVIGAIDGSVGCCDVLVLKASKEFLHVANALGSASRVAEGVIIVIFHVESGFKTLPLSFGEEGTEVGGVEVIGLISADRLHCVCLYMLALVCIDCDSTYVVGSEGKSFRSVLLHSGCGILQVFLVVSNEIVISQVFFRVQAIIRARVVASQSVVLGPTFRYNHPVEVCHGTHQSWIWHCLEGRAKETESPIDTRVPDSRLTGGPQRQLWSHSTISETIAV